MLWEGEVLPLAAALQLKRGAVLYRDVWFDKPPLVPVVYLLWGAATGPLLRVAGALYATSACWLAYAAAKARWSQREGIAAAALLAFFLIFDTHSAVLPMGADLLLLAPHLAAILLVWRGRPFWSGLAAGIGFLFNAKAVFVLAACVLFAWPSALPLLAGFAAPNVLALAWITATGSLAPYIDQVWRWPAQYAASPVVADPVWNGMVRTANWSGFHAALVIGFVCFWRRERDWKFLAWTALSSAGVVLGGRFFPRYYFLLLPVMCIAAAGGLRIGRSRWLVAIALLTLAVPLLRFGPRYASVANSKDLAMDRESRAASKIALSFAHPGATLYVWGYRPEIFVYTGLKPATRYLDSQALTGVPADRHLTQSSVVLTAGTREARSELARSRPDILIDGLSLYNPMLSMEKYDELRPWLRNYQEVGRSGGTVVYARR